MVLVLWLPDPPIGHVGPPTIGSMAGGSSISSDQSPGSDANPSANRFAAPSCTGLRGPIRSKSTWK